jgi:hypothetical protein
MSSGPVTLTRSSCCAALAVACLGVTAIAFAEVDLSGEWASLRHEDQIERGPGPELGDYTGLPINEAARRRGAAWDASLLTVPQHMCAPHPANYAAMHGNLRIWKEVRPENQQVVAWHLLHESYNRFRTVYMDGRPHPSPDERHTWQGFSTGRWVGNTLEITTTHLKESRVRRNGIERSDEAVLMEFLSRHGDILTFISILDDPHSLEEPYIHTRNFVLDVHQVMRPYPCRGAVEIDRPPGVVPHHLPGENPYLHIFQHQHGIPREAALGGARTTYPEYRERLRELLRTGEGS